MGTIEKKDILKICQKAKAASRQVSLLDSKLKKRNSERCFKEFT